MQLDCLGCAKPEGGTYIAGCRACRLRLIARGPWFAESMREGKLTPAYRAQLAGLGKAADVHAEVKAVAEQLRAGVVA